jgi:hypothetical protein
MGEERLLVRPCLSVSQFDAFFLHELATCTVGIIVGTQCRTRMTSDHISAIVAYVTRSEKDLCNVSVLQRVQLSINSPHLQPNDTRFHKGECDPSGRG